MYSVDCVVSECVLVYSPKYNWIISKYTVSMY